MTPNRNIAKIQNVSFAYQETKVLTDISFTIKRGEVTVLLGANGAGKTTLFNLVSQLTPLQQGDITLDNKSIKKDKWCALQPIGIVFQQNSLDLDLSVEQNLHYFAKLRGLDTSIIHTHLKQMNLNGILNKKIRKLSGGYRRRVEITRALLGDPKIIFLDEPTLGLDITIRQELIEHIHQIVQEKNIAICLSTHLTDEIRPQDQLYLLHQQRIKFSGNTKDLLDSSGYDDIESAIRHLMEPN